MEIGVGDRAYVRAGRAAEAVMNAMEGRTVFGALPCGTRVAKVKCEAGDITPKGTSGTVRGSMRIVDQLAYLVQWDGMGQYLAFVVAEKIAPAADE